MTCLGVQLLRMAKVMSISRSAATGMMIMIQKFVSLSVCHLSSGTDSNARFRARLRTIQSFILTDLNKEQTVLTIHPSSQKRCTETQMPTVFTDFGTRANPYAYARKRDATKPTSN